MTYSQPYDTHASTHVQSRPASQSEAVHYDSHTVPTRNVFIKSSLDPHFQPKAQRTVPTPPHHIHTRCTRPTPIFTMPSPSDRIRSASSHNTSLLAALHTTSTAPSTLYHHLQYIQDLSASQSHLEARLASHRTRVTKELADHKRYNESTFRRFAHKASGRTTQWTERAAKEEQEYVDAIQAQKSVEEELSNVKRLLGEAEARRGEYEAEARRHDEVQRELDALYEDVFRGFTPEFPDEGERKQALKETEGRLQGANWRLEKERHVGELVKKLCGRLLDAKRLLMQAHDMATRGLGAEGMYAGGAKGSLVGQADTCVRQARAISRQVRDIDPEVDGQGLGAMEEHIGAKWSGIVVGTRSSSGDESARIRRAETQIDWALQKGARLMKGRQAKETEVIAEINRIGAELKERKVELQWSREEAFRRVMGGEEIGERTMPTVGGEDEAPPAYSRN